MKCFRMMPHLFLLDFESYPLMLKRYSSFLCHWLCSFLEMVCLKAHIFLFVQGDAQDPLTANHRTLDLTSSLEVGPSPDNASGNSSSSSSSSRCILTIAFQFPFENNLQENVAGMACQYVRSVISSVQRVAMAISPSGISPSLGSKLSPGSPEAVTLAQWISQSYTSVSMFTYDSFL